jgi:hypothetical protein
LIKSSFEKTIFFIPDTIAVLTEEKKDNKASFEGDSIIMESLRPCFSVT